jgi:hypothetical protein
VPQAVKGIPMAKWTAEIESKGSKLYAWVAFNPEWGTFATSNPDHARVFDSEADVSAWIARLKVQGAKPVKVREGTPVLATAGKRRR